jgi:hypothetical protein
LPKRENPSLWKREAGGIFGERFDISETINNKHHKGGLE